MKIEIGKEYMYLGHPVRVRDFNDFEVRFETRLAEFGTCDPSELCEWPPASPPADTRPAARDYKKFECWDDRTPEEKQNIKAFRIDDAAREFAEGFYRKGDTSMTVCVQAGDKVRRFSAELEYEVNAFIDEIGEVVTSDQPSTVQE